MAQLGACRAKQKFRHGTSIAHGKSSVINIQMQFPRVSCALEILDLAKWRHGIYFIISIPLFALLYSQFPYGFYQSTVAQEGIVRDLDRRFSHMTQNVISSRLAKANELFGAENSSECRITNISQEPYEIRSVSPIIKLSTNGDRILSTWMTVPLWKNCGEGRQRQILFNTNFDIRQGYSRQLLVTDFFPDFGSRDSSQSLSSRASDFYDFAKISEIECDALTSHLPSLAFHDGVCSFSLSESEAQEIDDFLLSYNNAFDGYISGEGMLWRVLYLSTVTVTTLGYGDIVPITDVTRLLVALQSILGLVLMGLFINSVAGRR